MTLDAFTFIILSETSDPTEVAKRVVEILILQINQWPNMMSLGRGGEMSQAEDSELLTSAYPLHCNTRHSGTLPPSKLGNPT